MQAAMGIFEHYARVESKKSPKMTSRMMKWLSEIFGCPHKEMSRPFSRHGETYRVCIACGAHRRFDERTWNSLGPFYYEAANTSNLLEIDVTALRCTVSG
jgi:hypothetical protein